LIFQGKSGISWETSGMSPNEVFRRGKKDFIDFSRLIDYPGFLEYNSKDEFLQDWR